MVVLSQKLKAAIKLSPIRAYEIAFAADVHPSTLSKLLNGIEKVKVNDPRVLRIGEVVGISPKECFSKVKEKGEGFFHGRQSS